MCPVARCWLVRRLAPGEKNSGRWSLQLAPTDVRMLEGYPGHPNMWGALGSLRGVLLRIMLGSFQKPCHVRIYRNLYLEIWGLHAEMLSQVKKHQPEQRMQDFKIQFGQALVRCLFALTCSCRWPA